MAVVNRIRTHPDVFVGRTAQIDQVLAALSPTSTAPALVVSAVAGLGGIGKTTLARHCAALAVDRSWFPAGAYIVNFQGYTPGAHLQAAQVFAPLLRQLGVPPEHIPIDPSHQAALYDQTLATLPQRVLLIFDNISSATQVEGLLPTAGPHRAIVTTRDTLTLPATRLRLDTLKPDESLALLASVGDRITRDPTSATELAKSCDHLPLALRIAAALLTDDPDLTPHDLATELTQAPIDAFTHGDTAVATVFSLSWDRLTSRNPNAARVLRLLVLDPGPDLSTEAAAALADLSAPQTLVHLRTLQQANLLGRIEGRWRLHDLVRRYLRDHTPTTEADAATTRLLDHYTDTADAADRHLRALPGDPVPDRFTNRNDALGWLDAEGANLVAAVALAATSHYTRTTRLAVALDEFLEWRSHFADRLAVAQHGFTAASQLGDPNTLAKAQTYLGIALNEAGRFDEAITAHQTARDLHQQTGDRHSEAMAWNNLGLALSDVGRFDEAITTLQTARDLHQQTGDRRGEAMTWGNLGLVCSR